MNTENRKLVMEAVGEAGTYLKDKLQPTPEKLERNPYAHIWHAIKEKFGASYKDLSDDLFPQVLEHVKFVSDNSV